MSAPSETNPNVEVPQRHVTLWHADGNIVLRAELTLFRVHSFIICRESCGFKQLLEENKLPSNDNSESSPMVIPGRAVVLGGLLRLMYLPWGAKLGSGHRTVSIALSLDVMEAAKQYGCNRILRALADELPQELITAQKRLSIGVTCDLRDWALQAFTEVVLANFGADADADAGNIPAELLGKVWKARLLVSQSRQKNIVTPYNKHKFELICDCQERRILRTLAFTPRAKFRSRLFMDKEPERVCCRKLTQSWLEKIAGDHEEELKCVTRVWLST